MIASRITFDAEVAQRLATDAGSKILLAMAVKLQTHLMQRVNQPFPPASRGGLVDYLHKRSGWGQGHLIYQPTTPQEVARLGYVRVGWGQSAFYMALWESIRKPEPERRKGLLQALEEVRPELMRLAKLAG